MAAEHWTNHSLSIDERIIGAIASAVQAHKPETSEDSARATARALLEIHDRPLETRVRLAEDAVRRARAICQSAKTEGVRDRVNALASRVLTALGGAQQQESNPDCPCNPAAFQGRLLHM